MRYLLDFLQGWRPHRPDREHLIVRPVVLILVGLTIKQTFIVFGLAVGATVFYVWLKRGGYRHDRQRAIRLLTLTMTLACAMLLPWMARGLVTSGYVAFPQTVGRAEFDWAIPPEQLLSRQRTMSTNTRIRGGDQDEVLGSWNWLGPWLAKYVRNIMPTMLPTLISLGTLALYAWGRLRNREMNRDYRPALLALAPLLILLVFWFFTFPEPKYVRYIFWSLAALGAILAFEAWPTVDLRLRIIAAQGLALLCLAYVAMLVVRLNSYPLPAGPEGGFYEHWPVPYDQYETNSGLQLHVPRGHVNQCWHTPLPCTPFPVAELEARVPGELRHGFRIASNERAGPTDA